jgi:hypothetical protein
VLHNAYSYYVYLLFGLKYLYILVNSYFYAILLFSVYNLLINPRYYNFELYVSNFCFLAGEGASLEQISGGFWEVT